VFLLFGISSAVPIPSAWWSGLVGILSYLGCKLLPTTFCYILPTTLCPLILLPSIHDFSMPVPSVVHGAYVVAYPCSLQDCLPSF